MPMEKQNKLVDLSVAFAVEILNLVKYLKEQRETIISNQIGRSGTSIGANIHEAQNAHGKQHAPKQRADHGNKSRDTPFSTPFYL